ncbi:unnamed protein product [Rhodiola kirilowii]
MRRCVASRDGDQKDTVEGRRCVASQKSNLTIINAEGLRL